MMTVLLNAFLIPLGLFLLASTPAFVQGFLEGFRGSKPSPAPPRRTEEELQLCSEASDFCFELEFKGFAVQIRGRLEIDDIVGIYTDEQAAIHITEDGKGIVMRRTR